MIGRRWLLVLAALACVACVGCGVRPSGAISGLPAPTGPVNGVTLFLIRDDQLVPVLRATTTQLTPVEALTVLADGPTSAETAAALRTEVPTSVLPVNITNDATGVTIVVSVDPDQLSTMAIDQLACTAMTADVHGQALMTGTFVMTGEGHTIGPLACLK